MHVLPLSSEDASVLDSFVGAHPYGSVEQSWAWGELQTCIPGRPAFRVFGLFEEDQLLGSMLVIRQVMGMKKTWLWCPGGPLLPEGREEEGWELLLEACRHWARLSGDVFLRVEPRVPLGEGFVAQGKFAKNHYLPSDSLLLDLALPVDELLGQMAQKGRYHIKQAEKEGLVVKDGGEGDLSLFYGLLGDTATRDAFSVHSKDFYADFMRILGPRAKLYLAFLKETVVAGMLVTHFGSTATYYFGASSSAHRESKAPYLLQWRAIQEARKAGMKAYDFLGVAPEASKGHALEGVTQFKTRFGGKRITYEPAQVFVFRSVWWGIYRLAKSLFR